MENGFEVILSGTSSPSSPRSSAWNYFDFQYYKSTVKIRISRTRIKLVWKCSDASLKKYSAKTAFDYAGLTNAGEKALLLYLILFNESFEPTDICAKKYVSEKIVEKYYYDHWISSLIRGKLAHPLPEKFRQPLQASNLKQYKFPSLFKYILSTKKHQTDIFSYAYFNNEETKRNFDPRMAALYAYLFGKSKSSDFERFYYFWMSLSALMISVKVYGGSYEYRYVLQGITDSAAMDAFEIAEGLITKEESKKEWQKTGNGGQENTNTLFRQEVLYLKQNLLYCLIRDTAARKTNPLELNDFAFDRLETGFLKIKSNKKGLKAQEASAAADYKKVKDAADSLSQKASQISDRSDEICKLQCLIDRIEAQLGVSAISDQKQPALIKEKKKLKKQLQPILAEREASDLITDIMSLLEAALEIRNESCAKAASELEDKLEELSKNKAEWLKGEQERIKDIRNNYKKARALSVFYDLKDKLDAIEKGDPDVLREMRRFMLVDLPYFYRCKIIHTQVLLPLFRASSSSDKIVEFMGQVLETWLDENLPVYCCK